MGETMKYEQAAWALARALYEMERAAKNGPWVAATKIEHMSWKHKAQQCLNGWGYDNHQGDLCGRTVAPISEFHQAAHAAHTQYLASLVAKYGEYVPRPTYAQACGALAMYATNGAWEKLSEDEKRARNNQAAGMLAARGFKVSGDEIQLDNDDGAFFRTAASVLSTKNAFERIDALAKGDMRAFEACGKTFEAREIRSQRAYDMFGKDLLSVDETPGVGSVRVPLTETITYGKRTDEEIELSNPAQKYPTGADGAERYDTVTADASVLDGAEDVLARALYEAETPEERKHWNTLPDYFQKTYRMRASTQPLNLTELAETQLRQQEADKLNTLDNAERERLKHELWEKGKVSDTAMSGASKEVTAIDAQPESAANFYKLASIAYNVVRETDPSLFPWCDLRNMTQAHYVEAATRGWRGQLTNIEGKTYSDVYYVASTMRESADRIGTDLTATVDRAAPPVPPAQADGGRLRAVAQEIASRVEAVAKPTVAKTGWDELKAAVTNPPRSLRDEAELLGGDEPAFYKLANLTYEAVRVTRPSLRKWEDLTRKEQSTHDIACRYGWRRAHTAFRDGEYLWTHNAAHTFRDIADELGCLDLHTFVNTTQLYRVETRTSRGDAELVAKYAHAANTATR